MPKFKARIFYNVFEDIEIEADSYSEAKEKAYYSGGEGETHTEFDFIEVTEIK